MAAVGFLLSFALAGWSTIKFCKAKFRRNNTRLNDGLYVISWGLAILITSVFSGRARCCIGGLHRGRSCRQTVLYHGEQRHRGGDLKRAGCRDANTQ